MRQNRFQKSDPYRSAQAYNCKVFAFENIVFFGTKKSGNNASRESSRKKRPRQVVNIRDADERGPCRSYAQLFFAVSHFIRVAFNFVTERGDVGDFCKWIHDDQAQPGGAVKGGAREVKIAIADDLVADFILQR